MCVACPHTTTARARRTTPILGCVRALALLSLALTGCQLVFELDATPTPPSTERCGPFGAAVTSIEVDGLGGAKFDPQHGATPGELWLSSFFAGSQDVYHAQLVVEPGMYLADPGGPYNTPEDREWDPALTADGTLMFFLTTRGGADQIYQVEQIDGVFEGEANLVAGLPDGIAGYDLSADGLAVYGSGVDREMFVARRGSRTEPFLPIESLGFTGEYPSISADELEIYYNDLETGAIVRRTRKSKDASFGAEETPFENGVILMGIDPDLSHDGERLRYASPGGGSMFELTRECP